MSSSITQYPANHFHSNLPILTENDLLEAAKSGEAWAFSELCRRHSGRVFRTIYGITNNREDAEDALQDALLSAFRNLRQFDSRARFSTWLTRIGINSALMLLRKRRACRETSMFAKGNEENTWVEWEPEDGAIGPEERYLKQEMEDRLQSAIERLPHTYRSLTQIQYAGDKSVKQIADTLGISTAATKSRILRAKKLLRSNINSKPSVLSKQTPITA